MLRKILDYQFNIQGRPIDRSGQNNHGLATATVASFGPGEVRGVGFSSPHSRIDVPYSTSWSQLNAVQVEIRVMLGALAHRANLLEIERSMALFVRTDGVVVFTVLGPKNDDDPGPADPTAGIDSLTAIPPPSGSPDPTGTLIPNAIPPDAFVWRGVNTDVDFSPDGVKRLVPLQQYVTVRAVHDGIATMRIYIDEVLAGERTDIEHGVPPLISPGIVAVGAWPNDDRYTLKGNIDVLRVWREDPEFPYREFFCRDMPASTAACWHELFRGLADAFEDPEVRPSIRAILECVSSMQLAIARAAARASEQDRAELQVLSEAYLRHWCRGAIDGSAMAAVLEQFIALLERLDPRAFHSVLPNLLHCFGDPKVRALCRLADDIGPCDPAWVGFIGAIGRALPNPICSSPGVSKPSRDGKHKSKGGPDAL